MIKNTKIFALTILSTILLLAAFNASFVGLKAQSNASVTVLDSIGGTTDPAAGTYSYADGTSVTFTATETTGYAFQYWIVSTDAGANTAAVSSITIPVTGGVSYSLQAVFTPIQFPPSGVAVTNFATAAIVVVLPATGGTTSPPSGTYGLENATSLMLTATPASGWTFSHWVISGTPLTHGAYSFTATPTDNPYNVNHGYGNTYSYQAVFTPTSTSPSPTIPELSSLSVVIVAVLLAAVALGTFAYKKKTK